jgi:hypothetical protein
VRPLLVDALVVVLVASAPVTIERLRGLAHAGGDLSFMFIPHYAWWWSRPRWLGGWNPWIFGGFPSNADPLVGHVHPLGLLWAVFTPLTASALEGVAAPALAGVGMLLYLRRIGCGRTGSVVGAIAFAAGGYVHAHAVHPEKLRCVLAIPWALLAVEATRGPQLVAALGAAVAVIVAGGHPQTIGFSLALVGTYALLFSPDRRHRVVLALAAGVATTAISWLPAIELVGRSVHTQPVMQAVDYLTTACAHTVVVPFACGGGRGAFYGASIERFPQCGIVDCTSYPGMLVLLLVLGGLPRLVASSRGRFWLAALAAAVVFATGIFDRFLGVPALRAPSRAFLVADLALAAGAGIVAGAVTREGWTGRALATAALVLLAVVAFASTRGPVARRASAGSLAVLVATALAARRPAHGMLVAVLAADLVLFGSELHAGAPAPSRTQVRRVGDLLRRDGGPAGEWGRAIGVPGLPGAMWASVERVPVLQGWNVLVPAAFVRLLVGDGPTPPGYDFGLVQDHRVLGPESAVLDLLRTRMVVVRAGARATASLGGPRWRPVDRSTAWHVYANERVRPVAWLVDRVRVVPEAEALRIVRGEAGTFDPAEEALVSASIGVAPATGRVEVVTYDDDRLALRAETSAATLLVTSELAYPGWRVTIDDREAPVLSVNAGFRAVALPAGAHDVVFDYAPVRGRIGLALGAAGLLVILACTASARRRRDQAAGA